MFFISLLIGFVEQQTWPVKDWLQLLLFLLFWIPLFVIWSWGYSAETRKFQLPIVITLLNLSFPGYGPQAEVVAARLYGFDKRPETVVMAYFEGNDLRDAEYKAAGPWN